MLSCTEISFVVSFFNFDKFWVKPGSPFKQLNRANTQNLENLNFDMFYKNYCWAVICYPICVTNISYDREIIVLSFPVISFVILIFVFLGFEIKSGLPFYWLTLYSCFIHLSFLVWNSLSIACCKIRHACIFKWHITGRQYAVHLGGAMI